MGPSGALNWRCGLRAPPRGSDLCGRGLRRQVRLPRAQEYQGRMEHNAFFFVLCWFVLMFFFFCFLGGGGAFFLSILFSCCFTLYQVLCLVLFSCCVVHIRVLCSGFVFVSLIVLISCYFCSFVLSCVVCVVFLALH